MKLWVYLRIHAVDLQGISIIKKARTEKYPGELMAIVSWEEGMLLTNHEYMKKGSTIIEEIYKKSS